MSFHQSGRAWVVVRRAETWRRLLRIHCDRLHARSRPDPQQVVDDDIFAIVKSVLDRPAAVNLSLEFDRAARHAVIGGVYDVNESALRSLRHRTLRNDEDA